MRDSNCQKQASARFRQSNFKSTPLSIAFFVIHNDFVLTYVMAEVPLGSLHVYTRDSEFELILASSIKFTASEEDEVEDLRERLTANQLTENSSPRPYLYCVDSCSLLILLQCDAELATDEQHMLIETFSAQIQTAMVA